MNDYHYYYLKNTHSYDRAIGIIKFLSEQTKAVCDEAVLRFVASSYYTHLDYAVVHRESTKGLLRDTTDNFFKYCDKTFPSISVSIHFENNYFYLLFSNLEIYNLNYIITDIKTLQLQNIPLPDMRQIYNNFYLTHEFYNSSHISFDDYNITHYRPSLDARAQKQIKVILQQQIVQKNKDITYQEILKVDSMVSTTENINLMNKIKNVLAKFDNTKNYRPQPREGNSS